MGLSVQDLLVLRLFDVLRGLKYVLTQRAVAERLPDLDWFAMGLSVQDLLVLRLFDVDSMLLFRVTFDKLLQHKAYEMGSLWAAETRWTEHDFARLGQRTPRTSFARLSRPSRCATRRFRGSSPRPLCRPGHHYRLFRLKASAPGGECLCGRR